MPNATTGMRHLAIHRVSGLTPDVFLQTYLSGLGTPVIVTDAMSSWPALSRWTLDFFKDNYGADQIAVRTWLGPGEKFHKLTTVSDFVDYVNNPERPSPGLWIDGQTLFPCQAPAGSSRFPLYLAWSVFSLHPELLDDIHLSPEFVEDWLPLLPQPFRTIMDRATKYFSAGILMGPGNSQMGLHYDFLESHAYLAQIAGRKRCTLFSPEDSAALYDGRVDVETPDFQKFPLLHHATAYECTLEPGELLFMPYRWWHHVVGLEKSITVNYNFFNRVNFGPYLTHLLRVLPSLVDGIAQLPKERAALGIEWTSRGFDFPDSGNGL
jgi:hypothetical protein